MKKSEMVQLIENYLFSNYGYDKYHNDSAVNILDLIETEGMLPPFHEPTYMKVWRDGGSGHVWEKEE